MQHEIPAAQRFRPQADDALGNWWSNASVEPQLLYPYTWNVKQGGTRVMHHPFLTPCFLNVHPPFTSECPAFRVPAQLL